MPLIIDGWNLLRNKNSDIKVHRDSLMDSVGALVSRLEVYQMCHSDPITVVFDSRRRDSRIAFPRTSRLRILTAEDADDHIKRSIESTPPEQRRNLRVVSSDNEICAYAKLHSATVLRSDEFWAKLKRDRAAHNPGRGR